MTRATDNATRLPPVMRLGAGIAIYCLLVLVLSMAYPGSAPPAIGVMFLGVAFSLSCLVFGHPLRVAPFEDNRRLGVLVSRFVSVFGIAATTYVLWDTFALLAGFPRSS